MRQLNRHHTRYSRAYQMKSLVLCLLLIPLTALAEKDICTVQLPGDYPEELLISEDQYTQATALEAVLYL